MMIWDSADELRVAVPEQFAGAAVESLRSMWETALLENNARRFAIDISHLGECDPAGFTLLHKMHVHGVHIVAATPLSLAFLREISGPLKLGLAILRKSPQPDRLPVLLNDIQPEL